MELPDDVWITILGQMGAGDGDSVKAVAQTDRRLRGLVKEIASKGLMKLPQPTVWKGGAYMWHVGAHTTPLSSVVNYAMPPAGSYLAWQEGGFPRATRADHLHALPLYATMRLFSYNMFSVWRGMELPHPTWTDAQREEVENNKQYYGVCDEQRPSVRVHFSGGREEWGRLMLFLGNVTSEFFEAEGLLVNVTGDFGFDVGMVQEIPILLGGGDMLLVRLGGDGGLDVAMATAGVTFDGACPSALLDFSVCETED